MPPVRVRPWAISGTRTHAHAQAATHIHIRPGAKIPVFVSTFCAYPTVFLLSFHDNPSLYTHTHTHTHKHATNLNRFNPTSMIVFGGGGPPIKQTTFL